MNVGYTSRLFPNVEAECPICGSDIYVNKLGTNYKCANEKCLLNDGASELIDKINSVLFCM